jgi:UDP-4-amino-4,6-dideoxy-N-acetyl-beta-L-altrosamine transaminase
MRRFLPYGRQTIDDADVQSVAAALKLPLLTGGPLVDEFETQFSSATGAVHAVACNSGTAALHLAALGVDLSVGDAAIVPAITFLATANVVRMTGAEVVFADVDPETGLLTPESFEAAIACASAAGLRAKVAFPVHLNGQVCDMSGIQEIATRQGIGLIEDACHALGEENVGATRNSRAACFSTHPVKAIATGEGGVVTTRDSFMASRMRQLRTHGMVRDAIAFQDLELSGSREEPNPWAYEMHEIGWNYRLPDILCALGLSQIQKLPEFLRRRREIAVLYDRLFEPLAPRVRPIPHGRRPHGWHLYVVLIEFDQLGLSRGALMKALRSEGIGTQVHYIPVNRQPYYRKRYGEKRLPGAEAYYRRCLSLPIFPEMIDEDVRRVVSVLAQLTAQ